ncbi:MAG: YggT family protein [Candidatus Aminicenantes bacterium]|nr:YggT family protein [Candidatus Aminicenantes bacterium]
MILLANFLQAAATILHVVLRIYMFIILFRVILSWIRIPSLYQVTVILYHLTEPVLKPIRKYVPPYKMGGIDISPMIVFLILIFIDNFLVGSLSLYAQQILMQQTHQTYSF